MAMYPRRRGNMTRNQTLSRLLMQQERAAPPIQSHSQGLASMLRQGLAGFMMGQDRNQQEVAQKGYAEAMGVAPEMVDTGDFDPATGEPIQKMETQQAASNRSLQALLGDNPNNTYLAKMAAAAAVEQRARKQALDDEAARRKFQVDQTKAGWVRQDEQRQLDEERANFVANQKWARARQAAQQENIWDQNAAALKRRGNLDVEAAKLGGGQYMGKSMPAQDRNIAIRLSQKIKDGRASPEEVQAYNFAYQTLSQPKRWTDQSGQSWEIPPLDMSGYPRPAGAAMSVATDVGQQPTVGVPTGAKPIGVPKPTAGETEAQKLKAKRESANIEAMPNRRNAILSYEDERPGAKAAMDDIVELAKGMSTSGMVGSFMGMFDGSPQWQMNEKIKRIHGFVGLQSLIDAKKAGATFGALQKSEMDLLIAKAGAMNPLMEASDLKKTFEEILKIKDRANARAKSNFAEMYPDATRPWETKTPATPTREDALNELKRRKGSQR